MIKLPKKKYTPKQDVQLGKEAASEVRKQYPHHRGPAHREVPHADWQPPRRRGADGTEESVYEYSFTPVNLKDINAFALPGGPMFVQRGMFDAAAEEAEVAGVMAHELSRVLLRHGTANASKAQSPWLQLGQIAGAVGGAVVGGELGGYIAEGTQFGLGTLRLRYSGDYEKHVLHADGDGVGVVGIERLGDKASGEDAIRPDSARERAQDILIMRFANDLHETVDDRWNTSPSAMPFPRSSVKVLVGASRQRGAGAGSTRRSLATRRMAGMDPRSVGY